jgi:hypothetical protein
MPHAEIPAALKEFMDHRKHIKGKETAPEVKKKMGLSDHKGKAELEQSIEGIIEKKPKKKKQEASLDDFLDGIKE